MKPPNVAPITHPSIYESFDIYGTQHFSICFPGVQFYFSLIYADVEVFKLLLNLL